MRRAVEHSEYLAPLILVTRGHACHTSLVHSAYGNMGRAISSRRGCAGRASHELDSLWQRVPLLLFLCFGVRRPVRVRAEGCAPRQIFMLVVFGYSPAGGGEAFVPEKPSFSLNIDAQMKVGTEKGSAGPSQPTRDSAPAKQLFGDGGWYENSNIS
ncbi:hypothetical protein DL89DRAFT_63522 [Linderina pennispora]|uniref:Uncharacterized protein n=1 Tax=Linderina pennispora TaxID=61395 RepID=A0A1Y1VRN6_9FUNG|nr:uncharacterized protein DL89DRAFT_63522 [Linderina pennispora]ORX63843.1 hypothetical protein DL89DRAFT_63522 [Linderina pennispora]